MPGKTCVARSEAVADLGRAGRRIAGITCAEVAEMLPAAVDGDSGHRRLDRRVGRHVEQCLRCQAELAGYRRLLRALHELRTEVLLPPPGAVAACLAALAGAGERRAGAALLGGRRAAYLGGLVVAATAAGAGAAVVLVTRRRRSG